MSRRASFLSRSSYARFVRATLFFGSLLVAVLFSALFGAGLAHAATIFSEQTAEISSSTPDNAYVFAGQARVDAPLPADLCAVAGTLTVAAPVAGDALLAGGTVDLQKPVVGDVRIIGGRVSSDDSVGGDLMIAGGSVSVFGKAKSTNIIGGTVDVTNGSNGPVLIYGADVSLAGQFNGDVEVVSSDRVTLAEGTVIHGVFKYNAPQQADIPASAHIDGGVNYIGAATWLPTEQQAKTFATAGIWVFWLVRITAALVATGLIAGLFPVFADRVVETTLRKSPERLMLMTLLGFAGFIATPVLVILLVVSFVGIGIALILLAAYALFLLLSYVYASVLAGAIIMRYVRRRSAVYPRITWRVAILGVLALYLIGVIPYIGIIIRLVLCAAAGGALLSLFYRFAFRREPLDISSF
jgi:hypothetical protein